MMLKDTIVLERYFEVEHPKESKKANSNRSYWTGKLDRKEEVRILGMMWRVTSVQSNSGGKQVNITVYLEYVGKGLK